MNIYRLDRRFVFQAIGINLLLAAVVLGATAFTSTPWIQVAALMASLFLLARGAWLWFSPPVVARVDAEGVTIGGQLTVKQVNVSWSAVEGVSFDDHRIFLDRGDDTVLAFPLAYVGRRAPELVREVYERLNTANGYERFDPS